MNFDALNLQCGEPCVTILCAGVAFLATPGIDICALLKTITDAVKRLLRGISNGL